MAQTAPSRTERIAERRFAGCIHGLAIGDALGFAVEFMRLDEIRAVYGPEGVATFESVHNAPRLICTAHHPIGTYSDDTQMSLATANGLIAARSDDLDDIMDGIAAEYVKWLDDPENNRAPGQTCIEGATRLKEAVHWRDSGDTWSKGCGAAMRTAPIGLCFCHDTEKLREVAYHASACTHAHPTGIAAGIGTAYLVAMAATDMAPGDMPGRLCELTRDISAEFVSKIQEVEPMLAHDDHFEAIAELGEGWVGEEAVAIALYCFLKNPRDYRKTILMAANTNGDSDSIACIAGAISGAYNGVHAIPNEWVREVENSQGLTTTATQLHERYLSVRHREHR